jgi:hypothetical protein
MIFKTNLNWFKGILEELILSKSTRKCTRFREVQVISKVRVMKLFPKIPFYIQIVITFEFKIKWSQERSMLIIKLLERLGLMRIQGLRMSYLNTI